MDQNIAGYNSLSKDLNKVQGSEMQDVVQGVASSALQELELTMTDDEITTLTKKWQQAWDGSEVKGKWLKQAEENENYWLGNQYGKEGKEGERKLVDNVIFESLETFLPQATRKNPEPTVDIKEEDDTQKAEYAKLIKDRLAEVADRIKLRLKVKKGARHWAIYLLGVARMGWDMDANDVSVKIIRPQKMILDPEGTIDEDGYTGRFAGQFRKMEASLLVKIIPEKADIIKELVKDDMGTEVQFIDWWTNEYTCWTLDDKVLLKKKNPNWNYDKEETKPQVNEMGEEAPTEEQIPGINHFTSPRMPFIFLSIFNLGKKPVDDTSLITQNLSQQDVINKRNRQIDKNADNNNGGIVVSLERSGLTKDQAKGVSDALRKGGVISIPAGAPNDAISRFTGNNLPSDIFNQLDQARNRLRDVFGVQGSTASGIQNEDTVRGKIITKNLDADRIGGGITEYLEQFADDIYNHMVQMMYVYYPELQELWAQGFVPPRLLVSVKEGSLLPNDSTTIANQAIELAIAGKMSLLDMYKRLEYPNPEELASNVWVELNAPELLYQSNPLVQQAIALKAGALQKAAAQGQEEGAVPQEDPSMLQEVPTA